MDAQTPEAHADPGGAALAAIPRRYNFAEDVLARNLVAGRAGKAAYIDPRGIWTYGQLAERVARFGKVLRGLGIAREQRILICLTDTIDWPTAFLGAVKAGVVAVPVNTLMTEADYRFMLEDSRARLLVVSEELYPRFENLIKTCPDLEHVLVSGKEGHGHPLFEDRARRGRRARTSSRRPAATTSASGSTPRARPASPRARCTCMRRRG